MKYMGSKARIANEILPIILENRVQGQYYVEPFTGGCNIIDKVSGPRIASDNNKYLIEMWRGLQSNRIRPYDITKEMYNAARYDFNNRQNENFSDFEIGWIGWMGSFNGRFFDGCYSGKTKHRDYIKEQIQNTEKQIGKLKDILFYSCSYDELEIPDKSIIYCDPPYKGTKQYLSSKSFKHDNFWEWCREKSRSGHEVYISEYEAPFDFECIWSKTVTNSMNSKKTYKPIERLFKYKLVNN